MGLSYANPDFVAYARAYETSVSFDILIDIGHAETMPQAVAGAVAEVAADLTASAARRIAYTGLGALKHLQVRRLVGDPSRFGAFETTADALAWLDGGD